MGTWVSLNKKQTLRHQSHINDGVSPRGVLKIMSIIFIAVGSRMQVGWHRFRLILGWCPPCPATPRNGSLQEAEHGCSDRRTHLVPMRSAKVKLSLLLLSAGREETHCQSWVVQHEKKSLILTLNA